MIFDREVLRTRFDRDVLRTKLKATGIHLGLSLIVFAILAYLIVYEWYPGPYFTVDGGWQGIRLVAAVDLVLGPLITFLIFDLRKSRRAIMFDLITIATIQFGALIYGIYTTYNQRPLAIVLLDDFAFSTTMDLYAGTLESPKALEKYSDLRPPIIYAEIPLDREGLDKVQRIKVDDKILEHAQIWLYRPPAELVPALRKRQVLYAQMLDKFEQRDDFEAWLREQGKHEAEVLIAPFSGRYGRIWLVFDIDGNYLSYF